MSEELQKLYDQLYSLLIIQENSENIHLEDKKHKRLLYLTLDPYNQVYVEWRQGEFLNSEEVYQYFTEYMHLNNNQIKDCLQCCILQLI